MILDFESMFTASTGYIFFISPPLPPYTLALVEMCGIRINSSEAIVSFIVTVEPVACATVEKGWLQLNALFILYVSTWNLVKMSFDF